MKRFFSFLWVNGVFARLRITLLFLLVQALSFFSLCYVYSDVVACRVMRCQIWNLCAVQPIPILCRNNLHDSIITLPVSLFVFMTEAHSGIVN
jgi:hypothetical protein